MTASDQKRERFELGMATRRSVLGNAHVDRANAAMTEFDQPFQTFITEGAWGSVWSAPQLTRRERSLITIALLAALDHDEEVAMHVRATAIPWPRRRMFETPCCTSLSMPAFPRPIGRSKSPGLSTPRPRTGSRERDSTFRLAS